MGEKLRWLYATAFGVDRTGSVNGPIPSINEMIEKFLRFVRHPAAEPIGFHQIQQQIRELVQSLVARYLPASLYEIENRHSSATDITLREVRCGLVDGTILTTARIRVKPGLSADGHSGWKSVSGVLRREQFLIGEFFHPVLASVVLGMAAYGLLWLMAWILVPLFAVVHPILIPVGMVLPVFCAIPVATSGIAAAEGLKGKSQSIPGRMKRAAAVIGLMVISFFVALQFFAWGLLLLMAQAICRVGLAIVHLIEKPNPAVRAFGYVCFYVYLISLAPLVMATALFLGGTICFGAIAGAIVGLGRYLLLSNRKQMDVS